MAESVIERNRRQQTEWYGEPLGERLGRLRERLGLSQAALADVLGMSAPMLSQLMSGHRAKISNPAVLSRLLTVEELVADPGFDELPAREVRERLDAVRAEPVASATSVRLARGNRHEVIGVIQALLRELASAAEIEDAAARLDASHAELATFLRVYGAGRSGEAREHLARVLRWD